MHFFEILDNGYVLSIGETSGNVGNAITEERYHAIRTAMSEKTESPEGYTYKLRADNLEWELVDLPPEPEPAPTEEEALTRYANELTGGNAENIQEATETLIKIVKEDK